MSFSRKKGRERRMIKSRVKVWKLTLKLRRFSCLKFTFAVFVSTLLYA